MEPFVRVAPTSGGDYLLAGLFSVEMENDLAPAELWSQFENRNDLVYYNWELTGIRVHQWRLFCRSDVGASAGFRPRRRAGDGGQEVPLAARCRGKLAERLGNDAGQHGDGSHADSAG